MTLRMAIRALVSQPVRSAVLACGFGLGIASMAGLLGVGEVILDQSRSPSLQGGGDIVVYGAVGKVGSARYLVSEVLAAPPLVGRTVATSPSLDDTLYLVEDGSPPLAVRARGGIPSLERAIGDVETASFAGWEDLPGDRDWTSPAPGDVLRAMDRFHPIPDVPDRAGSWAEWLYFNGRTESARFYLTFLVGPRSGADRRSAVVRLQLERDGRMRTYGGSGDVREEELLANAPDLSIGGSSVTLVGSRYTIRLELYSQDAAPARGVSPRRPDLTGEIKLDASPGRSMPPFEVGGAGGWVSGYVVPVLSGRLDGSLTVGDEVVSLGGGEGYHDHNWGFWEGVSWRWGQVATDDLSLVYGRILPPADAADPDRMPGVLVVLGPDGPLGFSTDVTIEETDDPMTGLPTRITVRADGGTLSVTLDIAIEDAVRNSLDRGPFAEAGPGGEFLQLRATYRVEGKIGEREFSFTAPGAAETFRGR